jgi:hypothetical protein
MVVLRAVDPGRLVALLGRCGKLQDDFVTTTSIYVEEILKTWQD